MSPVLAVTLTMGTPPGVTVTATAWILILSEVWDLVEPGCNLRFHNISAQEYSYIEDQLKGLDICARTAYFNNLEQFIVTMPHDTHKALIVPFIIGMGTLFEAIPLSRGPYTIAVKVAPHILTCSLTGSDDPDLTTMCLYIFMETAFSQSEVDVMKKLKGYIMHNPHVLTIFKIKIKETYNALSQSPLSPNIKCFMGREFLTKAEFKWNLERGTLGVVHDGITWINMMGVEIHL
ncbi:hypothetical protein EDD16DRAFT_1517708 [Pisolithus croceorrhizus]|nr:hypothetical protein EDD16DRAFT_1517708 [Pisolithus croceorrhizus]KAI6150220.1 hypothetical protein EDD17DRAFT_1513578 [Pisolithus thermaeus]